MASQAIAVAAELRLADALADGPSPVTNWPVGSARTRRALELLLRALISRGIFRELHDGRSALTTLADTLRSDAPVSVAGVARYFGSRPRMLVFAVDAVRTAQSVVPSVARTTPSVTC